MQLPPNHHEQALIGHKVHGKLQRAGTLNFSEVFGYTHEGTEEDYPSFAADPFSLPKSLEILASSDSGKTLDPQETLPSQPIAYESFSASCFLLAPGVTVCHRILGRHLLPCALPSLRCLSRHPDAQAGANKAGNWGSQRKHASHPRNSLQRRRGTVIKASSSQV